MSDYIRRAIIVIPASRQAEGNLLALQLDPIGGGQTFAVGLSLSGEAPATHYWCSTVATEAQWDDIIQLGSFTTEDPLGRYTDSNGAWLYDGDLWQPNNVLFDQSLARLQVNSTT